MVESWCNARTQSTTEQIVRRYTNEQPITVCSVLRGAPSAPRIKQLTSRIIRMDSKNFTRRIQHHAVAMIANNTERAFAKHAAVLTYVTLRSHRGRRMSRALMHWALFRIGARRLWMRLVVLPYLKRFRPDRIEQLRRWCKIVMKG